MADHLRYIEKLNGENYGISKVRMKALSVRKELWNAVVSTTAEVIRRNESASTVPGEAAGQSTGTGSAAIEQVDD